MWSLIKVISQSPSTIQGVLQLKVSVYLVLNILSLYIIKDIHCPQLKTNIATSDSTRSVIEMGKGGDNPWSDLLNEMKFHW